jgi:general secretion pathway protein G
LSQLSDWNKLRRIEVKKKRVRRWAITLIEMIIVMILITTITGAIAYNYRESLNEGRAFKTKEGISRIETIVMLHLAEHTEDIANCSSVNWTAVVGDHPLVRGQRDFMRDGWGVPYDIRVERASDTGDVSVSVHSRDYDNYLQRKGVKRT